MIDWLIAGIDEDDCPDTWWLLAESAESLRYTRHIPGRYMDIPALHTQSSM